MKHLVLLFALAVGGFVVAAPSSGEAEQAEDLPVGRYLQVKCESAGGSFIWTTTIEVCCCNQGGASYYLSAHEAQSCGSVSCP